MVFLGFIRFKGKTAVMELYKVPRGIVDMVLSSFCGLSTFIEFEDKASSVRICGLGIQTSA